jgi:predicted  nucleic acid-binding Zn-ribbon protein
MDIETRITCAKNELANLHKLLEGRAERARNKLRIKLLNKELDKLKAERNSVKDSHSDLQIFEW